LFRCPPASETLGEFRYVAILICRSLNPPQPCFHQRQALNTPIEI
jgi:hypothetical protein